MLESMTPKSRPPRRLLVGPGLEPFIESRQRRMMLAALALLLVALGLVVYHDRDFWFPDSDEAQTDPSLRPLATPQHTIAVAKADPAPAKKLVSSRRRGRNVTASMMPAMPAAAPSAPAADPPVDTPPGITMSNRTVLPALEVEVVAGDNHRTPHPANNSVHVDLQPDPQPDPPAEAASSASPIAASSLGAGENASVVTNASDRMQLSANAVEVVSRPVNPDYPVLARQMKVQGSVILRAFIGRDGLIQDLRLISGAPILAAAAEEAVKQWHFKPHYLNGEPVETQAKITVNFTISTN